MALGDFIEILDLRHFAAPAFRSVLEAENLRWEQAMHWDYRSSSKLLIQYLDSHLLPGYAAIEANQVTGYTFCAYEENKAVIGNVFSMPAASQTAFEIEETLLRHLFELLLNSPQIDRIESQLLLHPSGLHSAIFRKAGFQVFRRLFMVRSLAWFISPPHADLPDELELRPWRDEDMDAASRLIVESYRNHPDSIINDQYHSTHGSIRFLHNIVRYSGCGAFSAQVSHVVVERSSGNLVALALGSRVSERSGHVTQICVHPKYRRLGLARLLLSTAAYHFRNQGASEVSLTVTEANVNAIDFYRAEGYNSAHTFDAAIWQRYGVA